MKTAIFVRILFALGASLVQAHALDLVRDGKAMVTIVSEAPREIAPAPVNGKQPRTKPGLETAEVLAVRTLVEWVKKITDVELPVANKATDATPAIYVGRAAVAAGLRLDDIASASHEGLRIVADSERVLIGG